MIKKQEGEADSDLFWQFEALGEQRDLPEGVEQVPRLTAELHQQVGR